MFNLTSFPLRLKNTLFGVLCIVTLVMNACNTQTYHETFDKEVWAYQDSLTFEFSNSKENQRAKVLLEIEFSDAFQYTNLYIQFRVVSPDSEKIESLANFQVADLAGNWLIENSWWKGRYGLFTLNENALFAKKGNYKITLTQFMRDDLLAGIQSVKLQIIPY